LTAIISKQYQEISITNGLMEMKQKELSELTDQELLDEAKK
jgi:hypothetical protein